MGLLFLLAACGPRTTAATEQPNPHFQLRITGFGLASLRSTIHSKGRQAAWMFDGPAQDLLFQNSDTIQHLFVLGKTDTTQHFDSAAISRNETMAFVVKVEKRTGLKLMKANAHAQFLVELVANGRVVQSAQVPAHGSGARQPTAKDSVATLTINTSTL